MSKQIKPNQTMSKNGAPKSEKAKAVVDTQITQVDEFNTKKMSFSDPVAGTVPGSSIATKKIFISVQNKDKTVGDLIFPTGRLFSFGVSENRDEAQNNKLNGYSLPICLWNKDGASEDEKIWTDKFTEVVEYCKKYLLDNKEELGLYELGKEDLKKIANCLYFKKVKGKIVEGTGPTLYAKLITRSGKSKGKKNDTESNKESSMIIKSMFCNKNGDSIDPLSLIGKFGYVKALIKFESIFINGSKISLQIKLYEAEYEQLENSMKPLLARPKGKVSLLTGKATNMNDMPDVDQEDDAEEPAPPSRKGAKKGPGSLQNSDDESDKKEAPVVEDREDREDEEPEPPKPERKIVKKLVAKKKT